MGPKQIAICNDMFNSLPNILKMRMKQTSSCIRVLDKIGLRERRKSCVARLQKEGRYAVSEINRAVSTKTAIEDSKRCNILAKR